MTTTVEAVLPTNTFNFTNTGSTIPRQYIVLTSDLLTETQVSALSGLPHLGDALSGTNAICTGVSGLMKKAREGTLKYVWDVNITYTIYTSSEITMPGANSRLLSYALGYRVYNVIPKRFWQTPDNKDPIQNSAGQPFDNPPTIEKYNTVVRWSQRENYWFNPSKAVDYMNKVNSSSTQVVGIRIKAGEGLLRNASSVLKRDQDGNIEYESTYEVEIDNDGFALSIRNNGYKKLVAGKPQDILKSDIDPADPNGTEKVNEPADLNLDGTVRTGEVGNPKFLDFEVIEEANWGNGLDLLRTVT